MGAFPKSTPRERALEGKREWTPTLELPDFGLRSSHGALGKSAQAIFQLLAERWAARSPMSVRMCKCIALSQ